ncbi:MAG: CC0125/CC1285 family lipoprotein [Phenylobacterium sp.]
MRLKRLVLAASLALAAGLTACTTATPYQPLLASAPGLGGYSDVRIEPGRYRVTFTGNSLTSRETVELYLAYRAAELTLANGYDTFTLVTRDTDRRTSTRLEPGPTPLPYWSPYWRYYGPYGWRVYDPWMDSPFGRPSMDVATVEKFTASAEIVLGKGPKRGEDPETFDARAVIENLGPRIQRPEDGRVKPAVSPAPGPRS